MKKKIFRMIINILLILLVSVAFLGCLYSWQRNMIFFPHPLDENAEHVAPFKEFEVTFSNNGATLHGWLLNPGRDRLIIYYGGNAEELSYTLGDYSSFSNFSALMVNYRGYGKSTGSPGEAEFFKDALHIFDLQRGKYKQIILIGRSIGSGVACYVAANRDAEKVVLITPFDSLLNIARKCYPYLPVSLVLRHRFDSFSYASKAKEKCLFILAKEDALIPNENSKRLFGEWAGEKEMLVIEGADHNSVGTYGQFWQAIREFITE